MKRRDTDLFYFMGVGVAKQPWIERSALDAKEMVKPQIFNIARRSAAIHLMSFGALQRSMGLQPMSHRRDADATL